MRRAARQAGKNENPRGSAQRAGGRAGRQAASSRSRSSWRRRNELPEVPFNYLNCKTPFPPPESRPLDSGIKRRAVPAPELLPMLLTVSNSGHPEQTFRTPSGQQAAGCSAGRSVNGPADRCFAARLASRVRAFFGNPPRFCLRTSWPELPRSFNFLLAPNYFWQRTGCRSDGRARGVRGLAGRQAGRQVEPASKRNKLSRNEKEKVVSKTPREPWRGI